MFYKYLTKQNRPKHKSATQHKASWPSTRPKLFQKQSFSFIETCFYVHVFFPAQCWATVLIFSGFLSNFFCRSIVLFHILKSKSFFIYTYKNKLI